MLIIERNHPSPPAVDFAFLRLRSNYREKTSSQWRLISRSERLRATFYFSDIQRTDNKGSHFICVRHSRLLIRADFPPSVSEMLRRLLLLSLPSSDSVSRTVIYKERHSSVTLAVARHSTNRLSMMRVMISWVDIGFPLSILSNLPRTFGIS